MLCALGCQSQESANYSGQGDSLTVADVTGSGDTSVAAGDVSAEVVGCDDANDCDDGLFCTTDKCKGGICAWEVVPYFCAIDGECVPGTVQPGNVCAACLPETDPWGWSPSPPMEGKLYGQYRCHDGALCPFKVNCRDKDCGDDGCGGDCSGQTNFAAACFQEGTGAYCDFDGMCKCVPDCDGKNCGDDGCKGSCGDCDGGAGCSGGVCGGPCVPDCSGLLAPDAECGSDGCGGSCGECSAGYLCGPPPDGYLCLPTGCYARPIPGCDGCKCEECVCAIDPYCCEQEWDAICAGECSGDCDACNPYADD